MSNTTTKHTPGPWIYRKHRGNFAMFGGVGMGLGQSPYNLAMIHNLGMDDPSDSAMRANARLIAAAPAMLEVLQQVADHFVGTDAPLGILAHAAIEQATTGDGTTVIG